MQIRYGNSEIEQLFMDFTKMKKKIGAVRTKSVKKQFDRIVAAVNMGVYLKLGLGRPHRLVGDYDGCYGIHIDANYRLIIRPLVELEQDVTVCEIVSIEKLEDYHG